MYDHVELATVLVGLDPFEHEDDKDEVWRMLTERFGIEPDKFNQLIDMLLPMIDVSRSPITDELSVGFTADLKTWLSKIEVKDA